MVPLTLTLTLLLAAAADEKAACLQAHEGAQLARARGALSEARETAQRCTREACPKLLRDECTRLLSELDADQPTLVFSVRDSLGNDTLDVALLIDGRQVAARLAATPVAVDPGEHLVRFEAADGSSAEQRIVARVKEKGRSITARLAPLRSAEPVVAAAAAPPPTAAVEAPPAQGSLRPGLKAAIAFGIVTVLSAGAFAGFGLAGQSLERSRAMTCSPSCTDAQVAPISLLYGFADGALGLAALSAVLAVVLLIAG